jgi:hypothetical protein
MNALTKKSRKAAISKTDPLALILRNCCRFWEERKLSHAEWLEEHKASVIAAGRVLQFLGLAEPDKQSVIGWKAKPRLFQIAKKARSLKCYSTEAPKTQDDEILLDMLYAIAAGVSVFTDVESSDYFDRHAYCHFRESVADFTSVVFEELGLTVVDDNYDEEKPTLLLRELFIQGAGKVAKFAGTAS